MGKITGRHKRVRIDLMLDPATIIRLDQMVKHGRQIYNHNGINRSRIIEKLILEKDPLKQAIDQAKYHQQQLMICRDHIEALEDDNQK